MSDDAPRLSDGWLLLLLAVVAALFWAAYAWTHDGAWLSPASMLTGLLIGFGLRRL